MTFPATCLPPRSSGDSADARTCATGYELVLLRALAAEDEPPCMLSLIDCINPCDGDLAQCEHWHARQRELFEAFSRLRRKGLVEELWGPDHPGGDRFVRTALGRVLVGQ